jgi:5-methylthioadenosine/S-adenosylhomocysteine deaminase
MPKIIIQFLICALFCTDLFASAKPNADLKNVILQGRVVTMNQSAEVIENGFVWVNDGVIIAVSASRRALNAALLEAKADAVTIPIVHVAGDILPGMIDLHNHPEYAIYPLLPITRKYKDRYEWRFYDDDYQRRITHLNTLMTQAQYFDLGMEVGRYGELKALVGGTTSLQGSRSTMAYSREECLVRNIETSPVTTRMAFSRVDIGRDAEEWRRMAEEKTKGMMAIHLAEGVGPRMANEFEALKRSGLLGPELIAIHGVGLTPPQFREMAAAGAKLVWSPLSNFILYGQTAKIDEARRAGLNISIAPDWAPSGSKSILGELKVADLVNKNALNNLFSDREFVEMVTTNPAAAMGWQGKLGRIAPGYLADMIVVDRTANDPYRNLINSIEENIKLVMVRGEVLYGDALLVRTFRNSKALESLPPVANRTKVIAPNCANSALPLMSVEDTVTRLQQGLQLDAGYMAKRVSIEQFARDFLICNIGKPSDPPTIEDAKKLLQCRFQLPFEQTTLSPLTTNGDDDFFKRLMLNPNLPAYLQALPGYYGAKRVTPQAAPSN